MTRRYYRIPKAFMSTSPTPNLSELRTLVKAAGMALALIFSLVGETTAQSGEDGLRYSQRFPGFNAVNVGMGGTGVAGVSDASALILNPAGLGYARSSSISGSFNSFDVTDDAFYRSGGDSFPSESQFNIGGIGHIATIYKFPTSQGSMVFGASFSQVGTYERDLFFDGDNGLNSITDFFMPLPGEFDIEQDVDGFFPEFFRTPSFIAYETFAIDFDQGLFDAGDPVPFLPAVSAGTVSQTGSVTEEGRLSELNFGASVEAAKDVMIGLSINIPFSRYTFTRILEEEDIFDDNDGTGGTTDFDYLRYVETFQSDLVGVNARLGLSARLSPQLNLGVTLETPTAFTIEDEYDTVLRTEFDNGDVFEYGNFSDEDAGSGRFEYEMTTPWHVGLGLSFETGPLMLMADVEWIDWSQLEFDNIPGALEENRNIREQFDSVVNTRLGASYRTGDFTIRGGVALYPDPHDDRFASGAAVDRERQFVSLGLGYQVSSDLSIDLGLMQERFDDQYSPYTEVANAPIVDEEVVRNRIQVGISYRLR